MMLRRAFFLALSSVALSSGASAKCGTVSYEVTVAVVPLHHLLRRRSFR